MTTPFADRVSAGRELAQAVRKLRLRPPLSVLALPRGGVPVALEVARALHAPLDVLVVRKLASPMQPEFAIGALAAGGITVYDSPQTSPGWEMPALAPLVHHEEVELKRRERLYRAGSPPLNLEGRTAILVDDGLATGCTMIAAVRAARRAGAVLVIAAAPVASDVAAARVQQEADRSVFLNIPFELLSVGEWYEEFSQLTDAEVLELLKQARTEIQVADER
ncbi:MAG TPA: phosphoribosyltransferase family protein [Steroidobacteraceae bacterium]|nr:phosphoribosyltransferase family protein [Steroidobacteraceae bacterium]